MEFRSRYHFYKKELSKLLNEFDSISFHQDEEVLTRILNLLTECKDANKIAGIISATEIIKYGGEITDEKATEIYEEIIDWFDSKR